MLRLRTAVLLLCLVPAVGLTQTKAPSAPGPQPVRLDGKAAPPVRTSGSLPAYPDDAKQRRMGGVVSVDVTIDPSGKVTGATALRSVPALAAAATDAVRHWTYRIAASAATTAPAPILMTVVFYFDADSGRVDEVHRVPAQGPQPRKTKTVPPVFPKSLQAGGASGQVVIEAVVSRLGHVIDTRVVRSTGRGFEAAAREAVGQWEYEPFVVDGSAVPFVVTATVLFSRK